MERSDIAMVGFISKTSSAGVVNVLLGWHPAHVILLSGVDQTNPNRYEWWNPACSVPSWPAANTMLTTGSTGVVTINTASLISLFTTSSLISAVETENSDPKHIDARTGLVLASGEIPGITPQGVAILAAAQTAGARNILLAYRNNV